MSAVDDMIIDDLAKTICDKTFSSSESSDQLKVELEKHKNLDISDRIKCVWKISDTIKMDRFLSVLSDTRLKNISEINNEEWENVLRVLHTLSCISDVPSLCSKLVRNGLFVNIEKIFSPLLTFSAKDMTEIHYAIISQLGVVAFTMVRSCQVQELNIFMKSNVLKLMIAFAKKLTKTSSFGSTMITSVDKIIQNIVYVGGGKQTNQKTVSGFFKKSNVSAFVHTKLASPQTIVAVRMQSSLLYRPATLTKRISVTKLAFECMEEDPRGCGNAGCKKIEPIEKRKFSKCSRCREIKYCSKQCQTEHWEVHSTHCHPIRKNITT